MSGAAEAEKVRELMADARLAMLTSVDGGAGRLVSRPMAVQEVEDDGTVWFFASDESPKADQLAADPSVNVAFTGGSSWVSLAGRGEIVHDREKVHQLWNAGVEAWFPDGPDSDDVALLRVTPESAEYWDTPGGKVASVLAFAKSKVTGERPDIGESGVVEL
ncbi:MAG: pyridoxamine 5'-phosphate oxidase family protein [Patulibacter minatonensis]